MAAMRAGLVLLVAASCHAWRARSLTAPDPSTDTRTLRLTTNQGARRLTLERATVRSDSVVGRLVDAAHRSGDRWVPTARLRRGSAQRSRSRISGRSRSRPTARRARSCSLGSLLRWPLPWRSTPSGGRKAGELSPRPASTEPNRTSLLRAEVPASRIHRTPHRHEARAVPLLQCLVLGRQCGAERSGPPKRTGPVAGASLDAR
jgi:hypothetical protein